MLCNITPMFNPANMVNPANECPISLGQISCKKSITVFANQQSVTLTDATSLQSREQEFLAKWIAGVAIY